MSIDVLKIIKTCAGCGVSETKKWYGMRTGIPTCLSCYIKQNAKKKRRAQKITHYNMWGEYG